jgi:hypothetical protein
MIKIVKKYVAILIRDPDGRRVNRATPPLTARWRLISLFERRPKVGHIREFADVIEFHWWSQLFVPVGVAPEDHMDPIYRGSQVRSRTNF